MKTKMEMAYDDESVKYMEAMTQTKGSQLAEHKIGNYSLTASERLLELSRIELQKEKLSENETDYHTKMSSAFLHLSKMVNETAHLSETQLKYVIDSVRETCRITDWNDNKLNRSPSTFWSLLLATAAFVNSCRSS